VVQTLYFKAGLEPKRTYRKRLTRLHSVNLLLVEYQKSVHLSHVEFARSDVDQDKYHAVGALLVTYQT
jgi:hypothetical protein